MVGRKIYGYLGRAVFKKLRSLRIYERKVWTYGVRC